MNSLLLQFRNQALGFIREPSAAIFNVLVPFLITLLQAFAFGEEQLGASLPGYRVVDVLAINAGVMFTMIIGLFGMGIGLSSMIEARALAGASLRPHGAGLLLSAYALVLLFMVLIGWSLSYLVLRIVWQAELPNKPFIAILVMIISVAMYLMLGACIASLGGTPRNTQGICSAIFFPMLFLSGAVFPIDTYPNALQTVAVWLPGYHVNELLTQTWLAGQPFNWINMTYVLTLLIAATITARWLLSRREDV